MSWIGDSVGPVESPVFSLRNTPPDVAPFARFEVTAGASGSGDSVDIDLAACNRAEFARVSHFNGAADFALSVIDSSGDVVDSFNTVSDEAVVHRYPRIEPGGCRRHGLAWNSGGIEAGDYRVRVTYLGAENGEQLGAVVSDPFSLP